MELTRLNPRVMSVKLYEKINKSDECISYCARLYYMISGDMTATVGGKKLGHIGTGELLYIPAGVPYRLRGKYLRLAVVPHTLYGGECLGAVPVSEFDKTIALESDTEPFDKPFKLSDMEWMRDELTKMAECYTAAEGSYLAELSARMKLILLRISETAVPNALPARMVEALGEYIRENIGDEISNTEVAAIFGYHPFYVSNVLKAAKGQTLRQYIISYRLKLAASMLECTDLSIAEIAEQCGFKDASYFTKSFRAALGETPKDYRNKFKEDYI